ncbi:S-adenosyl-L-methionine-dependent methyltransferase [Aspergillus egyptiacus]|nr:S-adenosyl-L-methionine-dependent methyltransferase [Aspergillus egyptiacus]
MANHEPTMAEWFQSLVEPAFILSKAMSYYIDTNLKAALRGQVLAPVLRSQELRDEAFGRFWVDFSSTRPDPSSSDSQGQPAVSLAPQETATGEGEIQSSTDLIPAILSQASGLVLDVGPGTGTQLPLLKNNSSIRAIYGAEPCAGLHGELLRRANEEGLGGIYTILPCSVVSEALRPELLRHGLATGSGSGSGVFDTIITVRVLCSVPQFERTAEELFALLKPGGKMLVVEHVVNPWRTAKGSLFARVLQVIYHALGWRWVMGDCCLDRDTERVLRGVNGGHGWESVEVERWFGRTCIPYISGVFVKKRN